MSEPMYERLYHPDFFVSEMCRDEDLYPDPEDRPYLTWHSQVELMPEFTWQWVGWLPDGMVTMIAGEVGSGKSALAMRIADTFIRGVSWPDGTPFQGVRRRVLWCDAEFAQVINLHRAREWHITLDGFVSPWDDPYHAIRLDDPVHQQQLTMLAHLPEIGLIIVDSLSGGSMRDENDVRASRVVKWLAELAQSCEKPVLLIHHLRKRGVMESTGEVALDRVRGSSALAQYVRMVWAVDVPNLAQRTRKRLSVIKSNLAVPPPSLGFQVTETGVVCTPDAPKGQEHTSRVEEACDFLTSYLREHGPTPAGALMAAAKEYGISQFALRRARERAGVEIEKVGHSGHWQWTLSGTKDLATHHLSDHSL
ncbi:MAG: AAA family ATPase [Armatimonadota bacterium]